MAKRAFRRVHRYSVNKYMSELNNEIDTAAEVDNCYFWRLVNSRRKRSCVSPGVEMTFNDETIRNPELITNEWGLYFKDLYSPYESDRFSTSFRETIYDDRNRITRLINSDTRQCEHITEDEVLNAIKRAKTGKACGGR